MDPRMLQVTRDSLVNDIMIWLEAKQSTLWADWMITEDDSRREAAEWFADQLASWGRYQIDHRVRGVPPAMMRAADEIMSERAWDVVA